MSDTNAYDQVKSLITQGKTKEEIYEELLRKGLTIDAIQESFVPYASQTEKEDTQKRTIRIVVTIGAVLVAAGIFSFIAANWQVMPRPVKIGIILAAMIASYSIGWHMKEESNLHKTGDALILLGSMVFGAGIFLVAQMFHVRANWPDGFILWMIGTVGMAFAAESYPLFYLAILLGMITLVSHPFGIASAVGHNAFLLTSSVLLLAATVVAAYTGWVFRKKIPPELREIY